KLGWIKPVKWDALSKNASSRQCWNYISDNADSDYLTFPKDAYWSSEWQIAQRVRNRKEILSRLNEMKNIDLIIAQGIWSGQDLASNQHNTPVLIISSINPQHVGIIRCEDGGLPHIFTKYDSEIIARQIRTFHLLTGFKKLGVIYDPDANLKIFSNLEELKSVASDRKFELVVKAVSFSRLPPDDAVKALSSAYNELAKETDAIWITAFIDKLNIHLPELLKPVFQNRIPTWSPYGERFVESGVLFGIRTFPEENGKDYAAAAAMIFNGASPGDIPPVVNSRYELVINQATAKIINYKIPKGLLFSTDSNYLSITQKKENAQNR
ncbi:MAG: ABC transporter substrate-binding protein, partial [Victivallaceae bacterium]